MKEVNNLSANLEYMEETRGDFAKRYPFNSTSWVCKKHAHNRHPAARG